MIRSDNTTEAEKLGDFFKNLDEKRLNVSTKMAKNVLKRPRRTEETGANAGSALASKSLKAVLSSLPEVMNFYHTGKRLYLDKFVLVML